MEQSRLFWQWLQYGASVYVCGDASRMARDVHRAIQHIAGRKGGMSAECAEEYIRQLKDQHRYSQSLLKLRG